MSLSDDFVVNVRQVAQYPFKATVDLTDLLLLQQGGLGGPYRTTNAQGLFAALIGTGGIALGILPPPSLKGFLSSFVTTPLGARQGFNWYSDQNGVLRYQQNGVAGIWSFADTQLSFSIAPTGVKDAQLWPAFNLWQLGFDGQMKVAQQIEVGRNPGRPNELVTLDYLQTRGVTSFNKRNGAITLAASDIYFALGLDGRDPLVTAGWVNGTICNALASWYYNTPLVFSFNGRVGTITLTDADISFACNQPGAQPRTVTPPPYDYSTRIANTAFVDDAITDAKSTIGSDLAAYAPLNSPVFTGTPQAPTANLGTNTGQLATTAFVMAAVAESVAGVATFNGRSGNVVLVAADVTSAGGAALDSPAFVGTPTA
ncbi:MAG TPA: hypothetical protein VHT52_11625, partial [Stellaceae bacterium]|nr:hypothetical protein [Stellaceae bacterium]